MLSKQEIKLNVKCLFKIEWDWFGSVRKVSKNKAWGEYDVDWIIYMVDLLYYTLSSHLNISNMVITTIKATSANIWTM